jgi:2-amino-4-hydroxy-6-hydroxymethyldihydropteridine diphosphokinase
MGTSVLPDLKEFYRWRDLSLDRQMVESPNKLILPHPRLQDRAFVLVPLADIAGDWCHPISGVSVRQMVNALSPGDVEAVRPL